MDQPVTISDEERERQVQALMDEFGLSELEAREFIATGLGEIDGDLRSSSPMTPEQRWAIGLDRGPYNDPAFAEQPVEATRRSS